MEHGEWSRSRFWLCHFLYNRHERAAISWDGAWGVPPKRVPLIRKWLTRSVAATCSVAWLVDHAAQHCDADPAYIQSVRLMAREQQYHKQLIERLCRRLGSEPLTTGRGWYCGRGQWLQRTLLGQRFELSVRLLCDLLQTLMLSVIARGCEYSALRGVCHNILSDKRSHVLFVAERLTMQYADFNFVRRNFRRLRLRLMWAMLLATACWQNRQLIADANSTIWRQFTYGLGQFHLLLELMVPYRRDALLSALLAQRDDPYGEPRHIVWQ